MQIVKKIDLRGKSYKLLIKCIICGKKRWYYSSAIKQGRGRFCSFKCSQKYNSGENHYMFGKTHSDESKKKISEAGKGRTAWNKGIEYTAIKGKNHFNWKGGRRKIASGYIILHKPEHHEANRHGYIKEHRYICEKIIGRELRAGETVHHINEIKDDNRPQNLYLFNNPTDHTIYHHLKNRNIITKSNLKDVC